MRPPIIDLKVGTPRNLAELNVGRIWPKIPAKKPLPVQPDIHPLKPDVKPPVLDTTDLKAIQAKLQEEMAALREDLKNLKPIPGPAGPPGKDGRDGKDGTPGPAKADAASASAIAALTVQVEALQREVAQQRDTLANLKGTIRVRLDPK